VPVISSIRHTIFFATALAAFWVLFAVGFYVVLHDPYDIFQRLAGFLGRPFAIGIFLFAGWLVAGGAFSHARKTLRPGNAKAGLMLGLFLTMLLIPCALAALTYYVFPFGTGLFRYVMPVYCGLMATCSLAIG
jgi:hypothetical protein